MQKREEKCPSHQTKEDDAGPEIYVVRTYKTGTYMEKKREREGKGLKEKAHNPLPRYWSVCLSFFELLLT